MEAAIERPIRTLFYDMRPINLWVVHATPPDPGGRYGYNPQEKLPMKRRRHGNNIQPGGGSTRVCMSMVEVDAVPTGLISILDIYYQSNAPPGHGLRLNLVET